MSTNAQDIKISTLEGYEQIAGVMAGRPLFHFSHVRSFYWVLREDELGSQWSDIELVMYESEPPHAQIGIRFHRVGVQKFSGFGQIMGLFFQSIQERGWESYRFEVGDYEDSHIHLFCYEISVFAPRNAA